MDARPREASEIGCSITGMKRKKHQRRPKEEASTSAMLVARRS